VVSVCFLSCDLSKTRSRSVGRKGIREARIERDFPTLFTTEAIRGGRGKDRFLGRLLIAGQCQPAGKYPIFIITRRVRKIPGGRVRH